MFTPKQIDEIFNEIDQDNSGTVDFSEVLVVRYMIVTLCLYICFPVILLSLICPDPACILPVRFEDYLKHAFPAGT